VSCGEPEGDDCMPQAPTETDVTSPVERVGKEAVSRRRRAVDGERNQRLRRELRKSLAGAS
jgi:hypothetical protein